MARTGSRIPLEAVSFCEPPNRFILVSERNTPGVRLCSSRLFGRFAPRIHHGARQSAAGVEGLRFADLYGAFPVK